MFLVYRGRSRHFGFLTGVAAALQRLQRPYKVDMH
jgi:hypothetical protein